MVTGRSSRLGPLNWRTHVTYERTAWRERAPRINALRRQVGLPETRLPTPRRAVALGALELQAYSPNVIGGRRPSHRVAVGWPRLGHRERVSLGESGLSPDLEDWLAAGSPPVYVGFGSVPVPDPERLITAIDTATAELGLRAVVCSGWTDLSAAGAVDPERIRAVGAVDHEVLLPRCRIAVHHGGSGTTAAAVRAGVPMLDLLAPRRPVALGRAHAAAGLWGAPALPRPDAGHADDRAAPPAQPRVRREHRRPRPGRQRRAGGGRGRGGSDHRHGRAGMGPDASG